MNEQITNQAYVLDPDTYFELLQVVQGRQHPTDRAAGIRLAASLTQCIPNVPHQRSNATMTQVAVKLT